MRQGHPLSAMFFILVMEALSGMIDRALLGGYLKGFDAAVGGVRTILVSHLLFVDDTVVFCDAIETQLDSLGQVLTWFQAGRG